MTLDDKKVVLLRYLLEGGRLTIEIENPDDNISSKEIVGFQGNEFGIYTGEDEDNEKFTVVEDITLKQYLCLAESMTEEELTYLVLQRNLDNDANEEDRIWM